MKDTVTATTHDAEKWERAHGPENDGDLHELLRCADPECSNPVRTRGMCSAHYSRWRRRNPEQVAADTAARNDPIRRLLRSAIAESPGCWIWQRATASGYGRVSDDGRVRAAHRWVYEMLIGPIPEGLVLDHLCRVSACVNPDHLEPVTQRVNVHRGRSPFALNARKERCPQGHLYSRRRSGGQRACSECKGSPR